MRTSRIRIKNLFGITDQTLSGKSVELSGPKGSGKTSVLDAIRFALTNRSDRDYIIRQGADEGEILIETDTGMTIERKARTKKADVIKVKEGSMMLTRPAEFLAGIFTPLQLNPIDFCQMPRQEKNRIILSLIEFDWDVQWIAEQFGEIPQGVDYSKHILEVLADIQSEKGIYFTSRQEINREIKNKKAFIADIAKDIPEDYDYDYWKNFPISAKYQELERIRRHNSDIERARTFKAGYDGRKRGIIAERDIAISAAEREIAQERTTLTAQIAALQERLGTLDGKLTQRKEVAESAANEKLAKLDKDVGVAVQYADMETQDTSALDEEIATAEAMRLHLNEYSRMMTMRGELAELTAQSAEYTRKIELARELPSVILASASMPIDGLTVEEGIPLIHGLPISNLSDGELLDLCVDITICRPGQLGIILVDGAERLDTESRERLYKKCKEKGLQLIATRVTDSDTLEVTELD